jgi:hypothetical protein
MIPAPFSPGPLLVCSSHTYANAAGGPDASESALDRADRLISYLQKTFGYALTGVTSEKAVFILNGGGNNGKSTLLSTFLKILEEYATLLQIDTLMVRQESNNTDPRHRRSMSRLWTCVLGIFSSKDGAVYALYRSATEETHRDIHVLASENDDKSFDGRLLHKWEINACPMSSMGFAESDGTVLGAWETGGQVYFSPLNVKRGSPEPVPAPSAGKGVGIQRTGRPWAADRWLILRQLPPRYRPRSRKAPVRGTDTIASVDLKN